LEYNSGVISVLALFSLFCLAALIYPFKPFGKRWVALISLLGCIGVVGFLVPKATTQPQPTQTVIPEDVARFWVKSERLNRRTCPSTDCGVVGQFFFREATMVFERRGGWARVTKPYDAACAGGTSEYVDSGKASCDPANGITNGRFSEWVSAEFLSEDRPPDPAADTSGAEELVAGSDDFSRFRTTFAEAAESLIADRRCTQQDFRDMGGWVKSTNHNNEPIYFTYCGGATTANRLYLNAETGKVFQ
jgi:hypothetical protein